MKRVLCHRVFCLLITVMLFVLLSFSVGAVEQYTIDDTEIVPIPDSYTYAYTINTLENASEDVKSTFNRPEDIFIDDNDSLYVVDSKNNRLVKMDTAGSVQMILKEANGKRFNAPQGVYVVKNGDIYLADTGNSRIVQMTADGTFVREYGKPESSKLIDVTAYTPTKVVCSESGIIYVLMGETIMCLDSENNFKGYIGQTAIGFDFTEWLLRLVASEEQQKAAGKRLASSYTNIALGTDDLIYATSMDETLGQIKVLNSVGTNIYRKAGSNKTALQKFWTNIRNGNIIGKEFQFAETVVIDGKRTQPLLADVAPHKNGCLTVVDRQTCRIYQYDSTGNLLAVFGEAGTNRGDFSIPVSIEVDSRGNLYVLDIGYGNIQVFEPTVFIQLVQQATITYNSGDYDEAEKLWNAVLEIDETYPLAHLGIANIAFKTGDYVKAMEGYRTYNDRTLYSKAFMEQRYLFMQKYFLLIIVVAAIVIAGLVWVISRLYQYSKQVVMDFDYMRVPKLTCGTGVWVAVHMQFRPAHTLESLRTSRGRLTYVTGAFILLAVLLARIGYIYGVNYIFQDIELSEVNLVLEVAKYLIPFFTWLLATYLIGSQFEGQAVVSELFFGYSSAMMPLAVVSVARTLISHCLCAEERVFFTAAGYVALAWMAYMMLRSLHTLNDFSAGRTLLVAVISLVAVVLIWFIAILGYTLVGRIFQFVQGITQEFVLVSG